MSKLRNNMIYQSVYQVLAVCVPLITSPYLSRVLGAEGLGIYSYYHSIVNYFILFALLGVTTYGMRAIAQSNGKEEVSKTFFSVYYFQLISSFATLFVYILFVVLFIKDGVGRVVSWIHIFYLLGECVNINWLFFGLEKYKTTVIRNIIIKILTVASIFLFVRQKDDVVIYILVLSLGVFVSNAVLWFKLGDCLMRVKVTWADVKQHIKPNVLLFIPALASSVYHIMDKTMLGMFSDIENSGYYYNADKLLNIPLTVIVGCSNVFMSRVCALVSQNKTDEVRKTQNEAANMGMCIIAAIAFGVCAVAKEFVPWFFGAGYDPCISLIKYFALIVILKTISTNTRSVFLIPEGNDKSYAKSITYGALINLVANYVLIATLDMGALGATLATLIAEFMVVVFQIVFMQKASRKICVNQLMKSMIYLVFGVVMMVVVWLIPLNFSGLFVKIVIEIAIGAVVYLTQCIILWRLRPSYLPDMIGDILKKFKLV